MELDWSSTHSLLSILILVVGFFMKEVYSQIKKCAAGLNTVQKDVAVIKAIMSNFGLKLFDHKSQGRLHDADGDEANGV